MFGITPEFALTVSPAMRTRKLIVDVTGLLYWQFHESRLLLKKPPVKMQLSSPDVVTGKY